jgi:hypothetical protein
LCDPIGGSDGQEGVGSDRVGAVGAVRGGVCVVADVAGVFGLRHTKRVATKSKGVAPQRWRYGSTRAPRPRTSTSTPIPRSRSKRSRGPRQSEPSPVDTGHPTNSSRSSKRGNYVERPIRQIPTQQGKTGLSRVVFNITMRGTYNRPCPLSRQPAQASPEGVSRGCRVLAHRQGRLAGGLAVRVDETECSASAGCGPVSDPPPVSP